MVSSVLWLAYSSVVLKNVRSIEGRVKPMSVKIVMVTSPNVMISVLVCGAVECTFGRSSQTKVY